MAGTQSNANKQPNKKTGSSRRVWLWVLLALIALAIVFTVSGFTYAANQEEHDAFCASCHTEPETTYVEQSTTPPPVTLAAYHAGEKTRCIDCHSGAGIDGRVKAELLGARNAMLWYTHNAVQPAKMTVPIEKANCLKCHEEVTQRGHVPEDPITLEGVRWRNGGEGGVNHWHEDLARWQATDPNAGTCTTCHVSHAMDGKPESAFLNAQTTRAVCEGCHDVMGEGD